MIEKIKMQSSAQSFLQQFSSPTSRDFCKAICTQYNDERMRVRRAIRS